MGISRQAWYQSLQRERGREIQAQSIVEQGTAYVSLVTDAWSRKIVGYHVHESLHTRHVAAALKMALVSRRTTSALIHHSDWGIQYCSQEYQALYQRYGVTCSMTDGYDCYQNALAEQVNGILKMEYLLVKPEDIVQARQMVRESVEIYNTRRPHLSLKYKRPMKFIRRFKAKKCQPISGQVYIRILSNRRKSVYLLSPRYPQWNNHRVSTSPDLPTILLPESPASSISSRFGRSITTNTITVADIYFCFI